MSEDLFNFLKVEYKNLIELEDTNNKKHGRVGNLIELMARGPVYILPDDLSLEVFLNIEDENFSLESKLNNNQNSIIIIQKYPGESIFLEDDIIGFKGFSASMISSGLRSLKEYYEILKKYPGRIISLGGESRSKALKWQRENRGVRGLRKEIFKKMLEDFIRRYSLYKFSEEAKIKPISEILKEYEEDLQLFEGIQEDRKLSSNLLMLKMYYLTLPSAAVIDFRGRKRILNIPGKIPLVVPRVEFKPEELKRMSQQELSEQISKNSGFFTLDDIIRMRPGSILDREISGGSIISIEDLYKLEAAYKTIMFSPINGSVLHKILSERMRLEREVMKYRVFVPKILEINSLDLIIGGSGSIRGPISINDPAKGVLLYNKTNSGYFIEIDPEELENKEIITVYNFRKRKISKVPLSYQNKRLERKAKEIEKKYADTYGLVYGEIPRDIWDNLTLFSLLLDEVLKYIPKKRISITDKK